MKQWLIRNGKQIWYTVCFLLLGLIDQRRGSAVGEVQMLFNNCTGIVIAALLVPSIDWSRFRAKIYLYWTPICLLLTLLLCAIGKEYWSYQYQWISGVLNLTVWSYFLIYIVRERKNMEVVIRNRQPFFWCIGIMLLLMQFSVHEGLLPLWYLLIFGGFYCIGIPKCNREDFWKGLLNGIIVWFFVQQIIAFGFRPYDYVRYRGLYSGETQNALFYMIAFCAFLAKWLWIKEKNEKCIWRFFYFFMAAGCVSFMLLTGSRAALIGTVIIAMFVCTWYDICREKSFYRWLLHGSVLLMCVIVTLPPVYGCIRYLPTILHHPIWFEGEYVEEESVRSFDSWDSERYISFEEALNTNLGRILDLLGIDVSKADNEKISFWGGLRVYAAEPERTEPGDSPSNPFVIEGADLSNSADVRKVIYCYYGQHLNWRGHSKADAGFYINGWDVMTHAHNMFLQVAYDYGIPAGVLLLGLYLWSMIRLVRRHTLHDIICIMFLLAILCFGMFEMVVTSGQITMTLMWILFYFAGEENLIRNKKALYGGIREDEQQ